MEYQVTARKWRPQLFCDIAGQESLVRAIKNALSTGRIPHAYLFSGIRGVGKTTTARIVAKALNCQNLTPEFEPCNTCASCQEITSGYSMDVIEIDGASNRGIDNIREIRDSVTYVPLSGKYKIYIIDEVHMLTNEASNALLKTLEEPPEHVIFILATTESHKVLPTIKSRCQHYVFRKISNKTIVEQLKTICTQEGFTFSEDALYMVANSADGSMRDAQSLFDQIVLYSNGNINEENTAGLIGLPDYHFYEKLLEAIRDKDIVLLLETVQNYCDSVGDIKLFIKGLISYLKTAVLVKKVPPNHELLDISELKYNQIKKLTEFLSVEELIRLINLLVDLFKDLRGDSNERFLLEVTLFKMVDYRNIIPLSEIRSELSQLIGGAVQKGPMTPMPIAPTVNKERPVAAPTPANTEVASRPVQAVKLIRPQDLVKKETPVAVEAKPVYQENGGPLSEINVKNAFIKVLSSSVIMKPMLAFIKALHLKNNNMVDIEISTQHAFEYLSKTKGDIEKNISEALEQAVVINFVYKGHDASSEKPANPEKPVPRKPEPIPGVLKRDPPSSPPPQQQKPAVEEKPKEPSDGSLTSTIIELFDGKSE